MNQQLSQPTTNRSIPEHALLRQHNRIVPFDQLVTFELTGRRNNVLEQVINVSIEGHFVAVAISYSVLPGIPIRFGPKAEPADDVPPPLGKLQDLTIGKLIAGFKEQLRSHKVGEVRIIELTKQMLRSGIQLNPNLADSVLAVDDGSTFPVDSLGNDLAALFQAVTFQQEVNFLYSIIDNATGRDFQSEPIHNIAGLGIANGDRPFRFFPQPIVFEPRSVIRVQITEISGIGRLYFVFQGYKVLGTRAQITE